MEKYCLEIAGLKRELPFVKINDELAYLNKKLRSLIISISYYNLKDVWINATAGIAHRGSREVAAYALDRWKRAAKVTMNISRY